MVHHQLLQVRDEQVETYLDLDQYRQLDPRAQVPLQALPMLRTLPGKREAYGPSAKVAYQQPHLCRSTRDASARVDARRFKGCRTVFQRAATLIHTSL